MSPNVRRALLPRGSGFAGAALLALSAVHGNVRAEPAAPQAPSSPQGLVFAPESPASLKHTAEAERLARRDLRETLFLCRPDALRVVKEQLERGTKVWVEPTKAFDNLFYVGSEFVGVWVLRTSAGLILFDAGTSAADVEQHIVPGLVKLGLSPRDIRYVVVTHGHWDHYGGAPQLQQAYGARIALGAADWDLLEKLPPSSPELVDHPIPKRDIALVEGQRIALGDTTVTFHITPGHTPATVSAIVPVREGERTYNLSLFGSVAFPATREPTEKTGGLRLYDASVQRFAAQSKDAGAVGILNTHVFAEGGLARLAAARARRPGEPNPFLLGEDAVARYYGVLHACLQAALARPEVVAAGPKPQVSAQTKPLSEPAAARSGRAPSQTR